MITFFTRRLVAAIVTLLAVATLTFFASHSIPGGPFDTEKAVPADVKANISAKFGLDKPVWLQYANYLKLVAKGDFGNSYRYQGGRQVSDIISETLPISAKLGFAAIFVSIVIGIPMGVLAAYKKSTWLDFSTMFLAVSGISLPNFLLASILVLVFSMYLGWLPPALWEGWDSAILPIATLAVRPIGLIARLTRSSMLEALQMDYIRTARAKGLSLRHVLFKHALKNSLVPVVTLLGPLAAAIVTGSLIVEQMFAIPGLGKHFVGAVIDRDYTMIMGVTIVYYAILMLANLTVDLLYAWIDPRIRLT